MNERNAENDYTLESDPKIWGGEYLNNLEHYGDDGTNCVLCGRKTGGKKNTVWILASHTGRAIPVAEVADLPGFDEGRDTLGCSPIGSECKKKIDEKYWIVEE